MTRAREATAFPSASFWTAATVIGFLLFLVVRAAWISDDAFITLRTIDNFVNGYGLRWNVAERVQAFTHPLWLLILTIPYAVTREPFYTTLGASLALTVVAVLALAWPVRRSSWGLVAVFAPLIASRAFVDYSTSGLENPLAHAVMASLVVAAAPREANRGLTFVALAVSAAGLARLDLILIAAPLLAYATWRVGPTRALRPLAIGLAPLAAWEIFSVVYYGTPFPNTAFAKLANGIPSGELAAQGLAYLRNVAVRDPATPLAIVIAALVVVMRRRPGEIALAVGVLCYVLYIVSIGGDFMAGRFLSPPLVLAAGLLGAWAAETSSRRLRVLVVAAAAASGLLAPVPTTVGGLAFSARQSDSVDRFGIADERRFYAGSSAVFNGRRDFRRPVSSDIPLARDLRETGTTLTVASAIGFAGYYAGPAVHIVDDHGLADPLLARLPCIERDPKYAGFMENYGHRHVLPWRPGHYLRAVPEGYLATLATARNSIVDPGIAALWESVATVTRGPIWSLPRWRALVRFNLAIASVPRTRPQFRNVPWDEILAIRPQSAEALFERGTIHANAGDSETALRDFREVLAIHPRHGGALRSAAELLAERGAFDEADALLARAVEAEPDNPKALAARAGISRSRGMRDRAFTFLRMAMELDPVSAVAYEGNLALLYGENGQVSEALKRLDAADELDPGLPSTAYNRATVLRSAGRNDEAVAALRETLERDPGFEVAALDLAGALFSAGDRRGMRDVLSSVVASNPRAARAREILARAPR